MSSQADDTEIDLFEGIDEKSLAGADFTAEVIGEIRRTFLALQESSGLTQKEVADCLGVSKSAVHRWLYGDGNMTVRKLGELVWAMGCRAAFTLKGDLYVDLECSTPVERVLPVQPLALQSPALPTDCYLLQPMCPENAKTLQASMGPGVPRLNLSGFNNLDLVQGQVMRVGTNQPIVHFRREPISDLEQLPRGVAAGKGHSLAANNNPSVTQSQVSSTRSIAVSTFGVGLAPAEVA